MILFGEFYEETGGPGENLRCRRCRHSPSAWWAGWGSNSGHVIIIIIAIILFTANSIGCLWVAQIFTFACAWWSGLGTVEMSESESVSCSTVILDFLLLSGWHESETIVGDAGCKTVFDCKLHKKKYIGDVLYTDHPGVVSFKIIT